MARRTVRQRAASVALVAGNAARRAGGAVRRVGRSAVAPAVRVIERRLPRGTRRRRVASAIVSGGSTVALAQARILPGAVGGYLAGKVERSQRKAHGAMINKGATSGGALIANPIWRLAAQLAASAFAASRLNGLAKEVVVGYAGGIGALYEIYSANDTFNPSDDYLSQVAQGMPGV